MNYTVLIERYAQKQIIKLGSKAIPVIKTAIAGLADNPRPYGYKKLKGERRLIVFGLETIGLSTKLMMT